MGNLEYKEITTDGPEIEPMNHNMQIKKLEPQVYWLIAGVMSQRPSLNVAGSAVGQVSGQVEKLLLFGVCVSTPPPFFLISWCWFPAFPVCVCVGGVGGCWCFYTARAEGLRAEKHFVRLCGGP